MIHFIRLNLLPYRDKARESKKKQFRNILLIAMFATLVLVVVLYYFLNFKIDTQRDRNSYLQLNIKMMNKDLKNISAMEKEKANLLAQRNSLENLQVERFLVPRMMNDLDRIVPKGVQLIKIEPAKNNQYIIYGRAVSDNRVAMLLKQIGSTGLFENNPVMNEIKTNNGAQEFKITVYLIDQIAALNKKK